MRIITILPILKKYRQRGIQVIFYIIYYINPITGERKSKLCAFEGFITEAEFQMMRKPNLELWQEYEMSKKVEIT